MEWLIGLLKSTVEYRDLTTNGFLSVGILTALGVVFFTCLQGYGTWEQGRTIWRKRSGKGVSSVMVIFSTCYFFAFFAYGMSQSSIAMALNGLLGFVFIPIVIGLWRFRGFSIAEWIYFAVCLALAPAMALVENKDLFLLVLLGAVIGTSIPQTVKAYQAWQASDPGAIEPKFFVVFMATNAFWFIYALAIGNWVLQIFNPISFANLSLTLTFWWLAKKRAERQREQRPRFGLRHKPSQEEIARLVERK